MVFDANNFDAAKPLKKRLKCLKIMRGKKKFKINRKFQINLFNEARFAHQVIEKAYKKKWKSFAKNFSSVKTKSGLFRVSKYFGQDLEEKQKKLALFNIRRKKLYARKNDGLITLSTSLVQTKFYKNEISAKQVILKNHICVNGKKVNKPNLILAKGDVVTVSERLITKLFDTLKKSNFNTQFKETKVSSFVSPRFEVSYSTCSFIYCF